MKKIKKYLSIYLSIFILIVSCYKPITVYAANSFSSGSVTIDGQTISAYVYSDPSLLPNQRQVYWALNGRVEHAPYTRALIVQLNKSLGLTFKDSWFSDFWSWCETNIFVSAAWLTAFINNGVYLVSNGNAIVGVALNDISGLQLSDDNSNNTQITIPSGLNNVTYNIVNEYLEYHPETTDIISFECVTGDYIEQNQPINQSNDYLDWLKDVVSGLSGNRYEFNYAPGFLVKTPQNYNGCVYADNIAFATFYNSSDFNFFVNEFSLSKDNYFISLVEQDSYNPYNTKNIRFNLYDSSYETISTLYKDIPPNEHDSDPNNYNTTYNLMKFTSEGCWKIMGNKSEFTVFRDLNIPVTISNNTYSQNIYKSSTWNNYNATSNTNTINTTYNEIVNSENTNQNIYNQTKTTTNNNTTENNFNYNYETNSNTTTTIINNYYGDSGDGGDDDDDDDDDTIWDALLKAIAEFFKKIGEFLAAILTGIVELFTEIVGAITNITTNLTGLTDFLASIFSWLPTEIVSIITLGFALGVFICLIKLFK